ncbi:MAG TPA: 5'-nucleotidase C-terminal domain-containing protein [Holophagaceae bacterium]|nr:5'-nucleotidase C-terminal domain-containing protein [Holophagaceae bacterium]
MPRILPLLLVLGLPVLAQAPGQNPARPAAAFDGFRIYPLDASIPPDPAVERELAPYRAKLEAKFGKVLCQAPHGLFRGRNGEPNLMGFWMADLMREAAAKATGAPVDAAITNSGGIRANFRPGPVTVGDVYEVMPFDNALVVVEMTGAELLRAVKQGIERRQGEPESNLKAVVSGTPEQPACTVTFLDGTPIDPAKTYRVATTDYLAKSGDTMRALKGSRTVLPTGLKLRDVMLAACEALGQAERPLLPPAGDRYLIPDAFLEPLRQQKVTFP